MISGRGLRSPALAALAATVIIVAAGLASGARLDGGAPRDEPGEGSAMESIAEGEDGTGGPGRAPPAADPDRLPLNRTVVIVGLLVAVVLFIRGGFPVPPDDSVPDPSVPPEPVGSAGVGAVDQEARVQAVVVGLDAALTVLGDEADPRLAVRLAYAELADGLGRAALRRWSAESETEYLERLLGALGGSGAALRRLTDLFSRARFSTEPISGAMRDEARAALHTLRAAVVGARTPGAGESRR